MENVDRILLAAKSRMGESTSERETALSLVQSYGAWFGQQMVRLGGHWAGVAEPVAPRVVLSNRTYCPFDAVERLLLGHGTRLQELFCELTSRRANDALDIESINREAWNRLSKDRSFAPPVLPLLSIEQATESLDEWLQVAWHEEAGGAIANEAGVVGKKVLCLAAAGGTHAPLFAMAGAKVTLVDFSQALLDVDDAVRRKFDLELELVCTPMQHLEELAEESFDLVVQPVSCSYVEDVRSVYESVSRVIKRRGVYLLQHKSPQSLQIAQSLSEGGYRLGFATGSVLREVSPELRGRFPHREGNSVEFAHSLDTLIGDLCKCGFVVEDFCEPVRADFWAPPESVAHRAIFAPPYLKIKARRK